MAPPMSDEPSGIGREEARQELAGRRGSGAGIAAYEVIAITVAMVGGAVAYEEIDNWSQWVVLGGIIVLLIGAIIALNPDRRGA